MKKFSLLSLLMILNIQAHAGEAIEAHNRAEFDNYWNQSNNKPTFLFIYASWCGWCAKERPIIEGIAENRDDVNFLKVDGEKIEGIKNDYGVKGYPTLLMINGDKTIKNIGYLSPAELNNFVNKGVKN